MQRMREPAELDMRRPYVALSLVTVVVLVIGCAATRESTPSHSLTGDWDAYIANGSTPLPGFEGWRRQGFAHFAQGDSGITGAIRRRTGEPLLDVAHVTIAGDSITLGGNPARANAQSLVARWHGDTIVGVLAANGKPAGRRI